MTREKYESLPLSMLKALAKSRNMKGISTLRKEALIERMLEEDQKENQKNMEEPAVLKEEKKTETVQDQNQEPQEKREDGMECQNRETSENGTAQVWYPITAQVVGEYMKARGLSSPPASIPVKLELESVRAPATAKLDTVSINVALANDASLCGFLKAK